MGKLFAVAVLFAVTFSGWLYVKSHPETIADYFHSPIDREQTVAAPLPTPAVFSPDKDPVQPQGKGIYRWVDEHGGIHYGDTPPARQEHVSQLRRLDMQPLSEVTLEPIAPWAPIVSAPPRAVGSSRLASQTIDEDVEPAGALCERATNELAALRARMRAGYRAYESDNLLARERYLRERVAEYCR